MIEEYRDIEGYEGRYQVSNLGNIKSLPRKYRLKEEVLKTRDMSSYKVVKLTKNYKTHGIQVHLIVAWAFLNYEGLVGKVWVGHIDGNLHNNRVDNLKLIN